MFELPLWNTIYVFSENKGQLAILKKVADKTLKVVESSLDIGQLEEFFKGYVIS